MPKVHVLLLLLEKQLLADANHFLLFFGDEEWDGVG